MKIQRYWDEFIEAVISLVTVSLKIYISVLLGLIGSSFTLTGRYVDQTKISFAVKGSLT